MYGEACCVSLARNLRGSRLLTPAQKAIANLFSVGEVIGVAKRLVEKFRFQQNQSSVYRSM
jgi:hypothetical protein